MRSLEVRILSFLSTHSCGLFESVTTPLYFCLMLVPSFWQMWNFYEMDPCLQKWGPTLEVIVTLCSYLHSVSCLKWKHTFASFLMMDRAGFATESSKSRQNKINLKLWTQIKPSSLNCLVLKWLSYAFCSQRC